MARLPLGTVRRGRGWPCGRLSFSRGKEAGASCLRFCPPQSPPVTPHNASETTSAYSSTLEEDTMKLCLLGPLATGFLLLLSGNLRDPRVRDPKLIWMSSELSFSSCCLGAVSLSVFFWENKALLERPFKTGPAEPRAGVLSRDCLLGPSGTAPLLSSKLRSPLGPIAMRGKELGKGLGLHKMTSASFQPCDGLMC